MAEIERFGVGVQAAQVYLFVFLFAVAAGTIIGGPIGDRIGRRYVIWGSILGVAPFTLAMPYAGLAGTVALSLSKISISCSWLVVANGVK